MWLNVTMQLDERPNGKEDESRRVYRGHEKVERTSEQLSRTCLSFIRASVTVPDLGFRDRMTVTFDVLACLRPWLIAALLVATSQAGSAQDLSMPNDIELQVTLGFSEVFRLGYWAPITVNAINHGKEIDGELQVQLTYGSELDDAVFTKTERRRLELSEGSQKRFRFTVLMESFGFPLRILVKNAGAVVAEQNVDLRRKFTDARLLLVVSRDANLDYLNDTVAESLRVLYPHPELLPDHWRGYDAVTAVVVHGISLETLSQRQFDALKKWVAQGGKLAVSGGPDYALMRTPRLAELLPASPSGLVTIKNAEAIGAALGELLPRSDAFHIHRLNVLEGTARAVVAGHPLIVEGRFGSGEVFYLSFDVANRPFDNWLGLRGVLFDTLQIAPSIRKSFDARELRKPSLVPLLVDRSSAGFPRLSVVIVFVALYLGLLATLFRINLGSSALRIVALFIAAPAMFLAGAYFLFGVVLFPTGASALITTLVEPLGNGPYARAYFDIGTFSKKRQPLPLVVESPEPAVIASQRPQRWGKTHSYNIVEGTNKIIDVDLPRSYTLNLFHGMDIVIHDVHAELLDSSTLRIRNNTGLDWGAAWLVANGTVADLGSVAHRDGDWQQLAVGTPVAEIRDAAWPKSLALPARLTSAQRHLGAVLLEERLEPYLATPGDRTALLVAIIPTPVRLGATNRHWVQDALGLLVIRLESIASGRRSAS